MLRVPLRSLLLLTLLAAAALLAGGGRARAGYVTPLSLVVRPSAGSFMVGAPQADSDDMGASSTEEALGQEANAPGDDAPGLLPSPAEWPSAGANFGASSGGAGCPSPSDGAGPGNSSQAPALASRPPIEAPALVGVLFLQTTLGQPPPFPSYLFRPPRLS
jgi:hypothetical protein